MGWIEGRRKETPGFERENKNWLGRAKRGDVGAGIVILS